VERYADRLPMPAAYFELALRLFGTSQFMRDELLAGTGVSAAQLSQPGAEMTLGQQLQQIRNVNRLAPAGWALGIGAAFQASTHGPLGFARLAHEVQRLCRRMLLPLAAAALLPFLPVVAIEVPLQELLMKLVSALA
jgi:hypothetical protein